MSDHPADRFNTAFDRVLQRRLAASQAPADPKRERLARATEEKQAAMAQREGTLVGGLGLDPDSAAGTVANLYASGWYGGARVLGDLATAPMDAYSMGQEAGLDQPTLDAYARRQQDRAAAEELRRLRRIPQGDPGQDRIAELEARQPAAREGDDALLDERVNPMAGLPRNHPRAVSEAADQAQGKQRATALERLDRAAKSRDIAETVDGATDIHSIVHQGNRDGLRKDLRDGQGQEVARQLSTALKAAKDGDGITAISEGVKGIANWVANTGKAAVDNPQASAEYIVENVPQLLLGAWSKAGMTVSNLGYGIENYRKGILEYQEENEGRFPPEDERREMALASFGAGLADMVGDASVLKAVMPKRAARDGLKDALLKPGKTLAAAGAAEGVTEGAQTKLEGVARREDVSALDVVEGSAIGAIAGAGMSGPRATVETAQGALQGTRKVAEKVEPRLAAYREQRKARQRAKETVQEDVPKETRQQAEESGDLSALTDPQSETYAPETAMETLLKRSQREEAAPEQRQANQEQGAKVVSQLEEEVGKLREDYEAQSGDIEDKLRQGLAKRQAKREALPEDAPAEERTRLDEEIAQLEGDLATFDNDPKAVKKQRQQAKARLERAERRLRSVTDMQSNLVRGSVPDAQTRRDLVSQADQAPDSEGSREAGEEVVRLAMEAPDSLDVEAVSRLAANTGNALSQSQRDFLARFSEARQQAHAAKGRKGVNTEVFEGGKDYVGINQYRARFASHLKAGNRERARAQLQGIESFAQRHADKLRAGQQAMDEIQASEGKVKRVDLVHDPEQGWQPAGRFLNKKERDSAGALVITQGGSARLLEDIAEESAAIRTAADELKAAHDLNAPAPASEATARPGPASADPEVLQQSNNEVTQQPDTSQETADAETAPAAPAADPVPEPAAETEAQPAPEPEPATETAEPSPAVDRSVDSSPEPTAPVAEDAEATAQPRADEDAGEPEAVAQDTQAQPETEVRTEENGETEEDGTRVDPETGEVIEDTPAQNFAPEQRGEGGLSVLADAVKRASGTLGNQAFRAANLVKQYVRQDEREVARRVTRRPLVEVRNFLAQLGRDESLARNFTAEDLTEKQQALVSHFASRLKDFNASLRESLPAWNPDHQPYFHQDFIQFFRDPETGRLDENILTAISLSAYSWLGENARNRVNDNKAINRLLGRQTKKPLTQEQIDALRYAGHRQNRVINDLGKRAAEALGLTVDNGVPQNIMPQIHGALGGRALAMLQKEGLVETDTITAEAMAKLREERLDPKFANAKHTFVRIPLGPQDPGRQEADEIAERTSGTQSLLSKLFGTQDSVPAPSLKKVPFRTKKAKRSPMLIPEALQRILKAENAKAHYVREDMLGLWSQLDENTRLRIAGGIDPARRVIHKANRSGVDGKNEALTREVRSFDEFVAQLRDSANGLASPFFLDRDVWKMQRVGLKNSQVNPQGSKVHRHLVKMGGWDHTVRLDNSDGSLDQFLLAVADGLGIKTDSQTNETSLQEVQDTILEDAVFNDGVIAIMQAQRGEAFDADAIEAAVSKGKEAMHSLDALVALAHYEAARETGDSTFTHTLTREVDGKTNGPMLAQWLLGAAGTAQGLLDMTVRGGFFTAQDGVRHIGEWAADKTHRDLYQKVAKRLTEVAALSQQRDPRQAAVYEALYFLTGNLSTEAEGVTKDGRNFVKTPVTALQFGSATKTVVEDMGLDLVSKIHDRIEKIANMTDPAERESERRALIAAVNTLRPGTLDASATIETLLEHEIKGDERTGIQAAFRKTLGQDIETTMEEVFEPFIKNRQPVNKAAGTAFELYDLAYRHARREYLKELARDDQLAWQKHKGKPLELLEDLSPEQEAEVERRVAAIMPKVHTPFSKAEGNLEAGLYLGKRASKYDSSQAYHNTTKLPKGETNVQANGERVMNEGPGVGALIWMIHASDSYIAASSYAGHQALNVHDALITGLGEIGATAQDLNRHTLEMLRDYSPAREVAEALERTLTAFEAYAEESGMAGDPQFQALMREMTETTDLGRVVSDAQRVAMAADRVKLEALSQLSYVSQYTQEDGEYAVTAEDRQRIQALQAETRQPFTTRAREAAGRVAGLVNKGAPSPAAEPDFAETPVSQETSAESSSPYAEQADGREDSSTDYDTETTPGSDATPETAEAMLAELESLTYTLEPVTVDTLIKVARRGASPATDQILDRLARHDLVQGSEVFLHGFTDGALGRVSASERQDGTWSQTVNINVGALRRLASGQRRNFAGNTPAETIAETLTHELIHAATLTALKDEGATGRRLNQRIAAIQGDIQAWITANPDAHAKLDASTRQALKIMVQEGLEVPTYGLTAKRVQDVLRRVPSRQGQGSAWSRFVKAIREALNLKGTRATVLDDILAVTDEALDAPPEATDPSTVSLAIETPPPNEGPMHFSTREIFDALRARSPEVSETQQAALDRLLEQVVDGLHGPYGAFQERARADEAVSAEDSFLNALSTGQAPFVSRSRAAGFALTDAEAFVLEQVEATLRTSMEVSGTNDLAREELKAVWQEAKAQIGPEAFHDGDWSQANDAEQRAAEAKHAFLFRLSADKGSRDDHLARFAALAMVHEPLRARLDFASRPAEANDGPRTLTQRLQDLFKRLLGLLHGRLTKTFAGQRADDKVWTLMDRLVEIEGRRRRQLTDDSVTWVNRAEDAMEGVSQRMRDRVVAFGKSDFVARRRNGFARGVPKVAAVVAGERTDELFNGFEAVRQRMFEQKQGILASLVSEARGAHDTATRTAHELLRKLAKANEQERMRQYETFRETVLESFSDNGRNLTAEDKQALTRTLLDADLAGLLDRFDEAELTELVADPKALRNQIRELEAELKAASPDWHRYYLGAGRDLAWHMATGEVRSEHLMLNAHNIAGLMGTRFQKRVSEAQVAQAETVLDPLISLYALHHTPAKHRTRTAEVMRREVARGQASGVGMVLSLHKRMQEQAQETLFEGDKVHMQKGYRAQIYNPHKSLETVSRDAMNDYVAQGYVKVADLPRDPHDPEQGVKVLMVLPDGGMNRRLSGIVSYTNEAMRGSPIHGGVTSTTREGRHRGNQRQNDKLLVQRDAYVTQLVRQGDRHSPTGRDFRSHLAPELNRQGEVVNYRYLMEHDTKDTVLDRNNAVDDVFGAMAAHAFDKAVSKEQNRTAIEALKAQYDAEYAENPRAYVRIAADSKDKQHAEAYKLLPDDAKRAVQELWGGNELWVRGDLVDINFGYQKPSLADAFKKEPEERNAFEKVFTWFVERFFGRKAYLRMRQGGGVWTEIVKEVKDILVVKTGLTLVGNVLSNLSLLVWHGVPARDIARDHRVALEGVLRWRRDRSELDKLRLQLDAGRMADRDAGEQRVRELERELERNPVAFMIDEGLMPTIVEDVDLHEDPYSYKSLLQQKTEGVTSQVWKPLRTLGRHAYMAHDTPLYKAFSQGTQVSDFVARYTLYQHLTTRKRQRMNHADAVQRASDMFINYDVPTHRMIQYLNDVGLLRFTKYYIRIQKAILTLYREHPARGMLMVALNSLMPGLALLTDSGALNKIGNPLEWGALDYPSVVDELATVKAALSPFN